MTLSLKQKLDKVSMTQAFEEIESCFEANNEIKCDIQECNFKITEKQLIKKYDNDLEKASNDLWDHRYSHCKTRLKNV